MSTEQVILNLDTVKPTEKFIEFNGVEHKINYKTVEEASEILLELTNQKDDNKLYLYILEQCIPSIVTEVKKMNDNQSKALIAKILEICFRINIDVAIKMLNNTSDESVKKK